MSNNLVLIDTSVWILALRKSYIPLAKEKVEYLLDREEAATTPMVSLELLGGVKSEREFSRLKSRLDALPQIPIGQAEWAQAARFAFQLRRAGKNIPYTDILIGSAAILADVPLLHADRHFDLMAEDTKLTVESLVSICLAFSIIDLYNERQMRCK